LADIAKSPERTDYLLAKIIDEGTIAKLWTPDGVDRRLVEMDHPYARGILRLRGLLQPRLNHADPDTALEQRVIAVLKGVVPEFKVHLVVVLERHAIEMDIAWEEYMIDGEADGQKVRLGSRGKFDGDPSEAEPPDPLRMADRPLHLDDGRSNHPRPGRPPLPPRRHRTGPLGRDRGD
jgi:hypothetical protein